MAAIQKPRSLAGFVALSLLGILGVLDVSSANCVENPVEVCRRIGFTSISLSRLFDAGASLDEIDATIQRLLPAVESGCSEDILPLICGAYLPLCDPETEERRAPCKDACRGIMSRQCKGFLRELGFRTEPAFSCADYPSKRRENCLSDLSVFRESAMTPSTTPSSRLEPAVVFSLDRMSPRAGNIAFEEPAISDAEYEVTYSSFDIAGLGGDGGTIVSNATSIPLALIWPGSRYNVLVRLQRNGTGVSPYEEAILDLYEYDHCQELTVPECATIGYTSYVQFPNSFGHANLGSATSDLQSALDLSKQQCGESSAVAGFFCSLFAPQCTSNPDDVIPPCRELCQAALLNCANLDTGDMPTDCSTLPSVNFFGVSCYNHSSELALSPPSGEDVGRLGDTMVAFCSGGRIGGRPQWLKPSQRPVTGNG
ncbi:uncharacterized protein [Diadema antillarum]|uniref:uncharacterized protein n=1 Tax=Diadema antillarum TaxID=105358 RepID=UPI003A85D2E7